VGMKAGITKDVLKEFLKIILATRLTAMEVCHYCGIHKQGPLGPVAPKRPMLIPSLYLPFPLGVCCDCIKSDKLDNVIKGVIEEYEKGLSPDDECIWSTIASNVIRDIWFMNTSIDVARTHSAAGNDTWMYYLTHALPYSHYAGFDQGNVEIKPRFCQADHTDDIPLTFGFPLTSTNFTREVNFTENDEILSESWIRYIANFCTSGNPNTDGKSRKRVAEQWNPYNEEEGDFLKVRYPFESAKNMFEERIKFWRDTVPELYRRRIHKRKQRNLFQG